MKRRLFLSAPFAFLSRAKGQDRSAVAARMHQALTTNLLGFWLPRSIDRKNGGYHINYGPTGEPNGRTTKMIVTQARQVWLFSRIARSGLARKEYPDKDLLAAAEHGYRFLRDQLWDKTKAASTGKSTQAARKRCVPESTCTETRSACMHCRSTTWPAKTVRR